MLRNHHKSEQLLKHLFPSIVQQHRLFQQQTPTLYSKNVFRQGKIMGKLFGQRLSGSKKRWFPSTDSTSATSPSILFKQTQYGGKVVSGGDKHTVRRMTVLNKLFMYHITDLMATGEISENILGKGLQVSRVKISQDFAYLNVYWLSNSDVDKDVILEQELERCSGLLRHELSQLDLMGVVPRIKFVKDKFLSNMYQVENLLKNMDFGPDEEQYLTEVDMHKTDVFKQAFFYGPKTNDANQKNFEGNENESTSNENLKSVEYEIPEMRHDVLGLDHKGIMMKIFTKMKKSKQAWDQHFQNTSTPVEKANVTDNSSAISSAYELAKRNEKLQNAADNSEKFQAFLTNRKGKRNTPERKKFRITDHQVDDVNITVDENDYMTKIMSKHQLQIFQAGDYLNDDLDDEKPK